MKRRDRFLILERLKSEIELLKITNAAPIMSARVRNSKGQWEDSRGTVTMRIALEDAYAILMTARRKGWTCAQVVHSRDWSEE